MRVVELAWVVDMRDQTILISGIGIAGPTLAYWLGRYGHKATLIEQAPRLRTGGYVIDSPLCRLTSVRTTTAFGR